MAALSYSVYSLFKQLVEDHFLHHVRLCCFDKWIIYSESKWSTLKDLTWDCLTVVMRIMPLWDKTWLWFPRLYPPSLDRRNVANWGKVEEIRSLPPFSCAISNVCHQETQLRITYLLTCLFFVSFEYKNKKRWPLVCTNHVQLAWLSFVFQVQFLLLVTSVFHIAVGRDYKTVNLF